MRAPYPIATIAGLAALTLAAMSLAGASPSVAAEGCTLSAKMIAQRDILGQIPLKIPSGAMVPTLEIGMVVSVKAIPAEAPLKRGEAIAFCLHRDRQTIYLMRAVALAGDRVRLDHNRLTINGQDLAREPAGSVPYDGLAGKPKLDCFRETNEGRTYRICTAPEGSPLDTTAEVIVPAGHVFVLGDNRDNAADSRLPQTGFVAEAEIIGRVTLKNRGSEAVPVDAD